MTTRTLLRIGALAGATAALALGLTACNEPGTSSITRPVDPVVVKGSSLTRLIGSAPGDIVGFRHVPAGWQQVPVQVDQRRQLDLGIVYHDAAGGPIIEGYADPNTYAGADTDPKLDADDELAFMAKDLGGPVPIGTAAPSGVVASTAVDVTVTDPLRAGTEGHLVLFRRSVGSTRIPSAGKSYVTYAFGLTSGDYKTTYKFTAGPNPENTTVVTPTYTRHFSDRWLGDQLVIKAGASTRVDILERNKFSFSPGYCGRSEDTFDNGEGAFIANISGPVRAIRSYIGANSGVWTQREHHFYGAREDVTTFLRVHTIPGTIDYYDYSRAAVGMTYRNNQNTAGVIIDGNPDSVTAGQLTWESLDGPQGSVVQGGRLTTNLTLTQSSWYEDDFTPSTTQCTGDSESIGQSGPRITAGLSCTDPGTNCTGNLTYRRSLVYGAPGVGPGTAAQTASRATNDLTTATAPWTPA